MSDDESAYSDAEKRKKKDEGANFLKSRQQMKMSELDEQLAEYIAEWRKQRQKEEDELNKLREKQAKRKILRAEEEKKLAEQKKAEEDRKQREESDRKAKEQEEKRKRLEEAEKKRQQMMKPSDGAKKFGSKSGDKLSNIQAAKGELGKTKEQLAEEKKIAMSIRVQPLNLDGMQPSQLRNKAEAMWNLIIKLETEKYDMEERMKRQDYDLKELRERQKQQLRQKALKKGLDPEALTGKHPPKIQTASKFERRTDRRTYDDKKKLFEGGWEDVRKEELEKVWKEHYEEFMARTVTRLPKWFGERPGKKGAKGTDTPEEGEEGDNEPRHHHLLLKKRRRRKKKRRRRRRKKRRKKKRKKRRRKRKKSDLRHAVGFHHNLLAAHQLATPVGGRPPARLLKKSIFLPPLPSLPLHRHVTASKESPPCTRHRALFDFRMFPVPTPHPFRSASCLWGGGVAPALHAPSPPFCPEPPEWERRGGGLHGVTLHNISLAGTASSTSAGNIICVTCSNDWYNINIIEEIYKYILNAFYILM